MSYSLTRATTINLLGYFYLLLATLLTTPALIQALTIPIFGRYALMLGLLTLATATDFGLSRSVVYHLCNSSNKAATSRTLAASFWLHLSLGLVYSVCATIFGLPALGLLILATYILGHYQALPESRGRFGIVNLRAILIGTTNTFGALYLARSGHGVEAILIALTLSTLLTAVIVKYSSAPASVTRPDIREIKLLLSYGLRSQLGKLVGTLQSQYPKLLLVNNPLGLTVYSLASSLISRTTAVISQFATAYFPQASSTKASDKKTYLSLQFSLLLVAITGVLLYPYFGLSLLEWWLKDQALASSLHAFLLPYRYYGALLLLTPLAATRLDSHNRPATASLYGAMALLIELSVVGFYYPQLGVISVAYGAVLSLVIMVPILLTSAQKSVPLRDNLSH